MPKHKLVMDKRIEKSFVELEFKTMSSLIEVLEMYGRKRIWN